MSIKFIAIMLLRTLQISIQEKHRILTRRRFIDIKSLHMMYYRQSDRSMGLCTCIINEFLMLFLNNCYNFACNLLSSAVSMLLYIF